MKGILHLSRKQYLNFLIMKKLVLALSFVFVLGLVSVNAQVKKTTVKKDSTKTEQTTTVKKTAKTPTVKKPIDKKTVKTVKTVKTTTTPETK